MRALLPKRHLLAGITVLGLHGLWHVDGIVSLPWIDPLIKAQVDKNTRVMTTPPLIRLSASSFSSAVVQKPKPVKPVKPVSPPPHPQPKTSVHAPSVISPSAVSSSASVSSSSPISAAPVTSMAEAHREVTSSALLGSTNSLQTQATALASSTPQAQSPPLPTLTAWPDACLVHYTVNAYSKGFSLTLSGQLIWTPDQEKKTYQLSLQSRSLLLRDRMLSSHGRLTAQGLQPIRFSDKNRTEQAAHFIWDQNKIVFSNNAPEVSLEPGMQDRVSLFLQMSSHLLSHSHTPWNAGDIVPMAVVGVDGITHWDITFEKEEPLSLKNQSLLTQKWVKGFKERDNRAELWFAPSLQFLPVRIRQTQENGDIIDMQIDSINNSAL
jgi:hypothetical protein